MKKAKYFIKYMYGNGVGQTNVYETYKMYIKALNKLKKGVWYTEFKYGKIKDETVEK